MNTVLSRLRTWIGGLALLILAAACTMPGPAFAPPPTAPAARAPAVSAGSTRLIIAPEPPAGRVIVDGVPRGSAPLTLTLPAGEHRIELQADGYAPLSETIALEAGAEATYAPELEDVAPPVVRLSSDRAQVAWNGQAEVRVTASDNAGVAALALLLDEQTLAATEGEEIVFTFAPATLPGLAPGRPYTLTAMAADAAGNADEASLVVHVLPVTAAAPTATPAASATAAPTASATPIPTATPTTAAATPTAAPPGPTATRPPAVTFRVTQVTIPTYPYRAFLRSVADPTMGGYEVLTLDRAAYEAANPRPAPVSYTLLVLENRYLRISLLPQLGGRIYEVIFKPTGNNELYRNPVIKPTGWGPPGPPYPAGANWWLAAGGIEWGFPVEEHGYEWGKEWGYNTLRLPDGGVQVSLVPRDFEHPYATVNVILPPEVGYFVLEPTIVNPTAAPARVKWWLNAMLAPGAANAPGPELRFILPAQEVTVHSTGDPTLPGPDAPMAWPIHAGRDMSRLGNWGQYLGFFARPAAGGGYTAVYDPTIEEGMVRVYPATVARGAKFFAPGWSQPIGPETYTDDRSGYVEMHGGLTPTFNDWYELPAGGHVSWTETWYPVADIGGITWATAAGALHLAPEPAGLRVRLAPTRPVRGEVRVAVAGAAPISVRVDISPAQPLDERIPLPAAAPAAGEVRISLRDAQGVILFEYTGHVRLRP
ncbi:MAG: DUF5107 domain-containing protein [Anaerolineae bacterium]|nr:DUF5107 domain-containing protein [Anaerolineae bacterium]